MPRLFRKGCASCDGSDRLVSGMFTSKNAKEDTETLLDGFLDGIDARSLEKLSSEALP